MFCLLIFEGYVLRLKIILFSGRIRLQPFERFDRRNFVRNKSSLDRRHETEVAKKLSSRLSQHFAGLVSKPFFGVI